MIPFSSEFFSRPEKSCTMFSFPDVPSNSIRPKYSCPGFLWVHATNLVRFVCNSASSEVTLNNIFTFGNIYQFIPGLFSREFLAVPIMQLLSVNARSEETERTTNPYKIQFPERICLTVNSFLRKYILSRKFSMWNCCHCIISDVLSRIYSESETD